jgi:ammonium transporter, Amt family
MRRRILKGALVWIIALIIANLMVGSVFAQEDDDAAEGEDAAPVEEVVAEEAVVDETAATLATLTANLDTVWLLVAAFLVFWMQAGFALVEAGFVRAKNVVNILMKNMFDFVIGTLVYWAIGFGIMFGGTDDFFGNTYFFLNDIPDIWAPLTVPTYAFFFFQLVFAATAATIVSGAMAERTEFKGYLVYSAVISAFIYPVVGHWIWGGGFLAQRETPFWDFAGSTVVHSTGGWLALVGAFILGPRKGRYGKGGGPIAGHSMPLAVLGVFILWLGWFGFNPGSQLNADAAAISLITVNTNIAAAAGALTAIMMGWVMEGKAQLPWGLNGALAGLVAITAPCAWVTPAESILIGVIGAVVMYAVVKGLDIAQIDDPVGAVGVHLGGGVWGTLAVGIFADGAVQGLLHGGGADQLVTQIVGILAVAAYVVVTGIVLFMVLKAIDWLRIHDEGETLGTDLYEHGQAAYPDFGSSTIIPGTAGGD